MDIALIVILALVIIVASIVRAFGNIVGAGGNLSKSLSESNDADKKEAARNNTQSQIFRTIGGVLFGVLLLCPIMYRHKINGYPFINIDHQVRDYLVGFLVATEVLVFVMIWVVDRKAQK